MLFLVIPIGANRLSRLTCSEILQACPDLLTVSSVLFFYANSFSSVCFQFIFEYGLDLLPPVLMVFSALFSLSWTATIGPVWSLLILPPFFRCMTVTCSRFTMTSGGPVLTPLGIPFGELVDVFKTFATNYRNLNILYSSHDPWGCKAHSVS